MIRESAVSVPAMDNDKKKSSNCIKVLQIAHGMETFGGVESFLIQYYRNIDHERVVFDFLFCGNDTLQKIKGDAVLDDSNIVALQDLKPGRNRIKNYISMGRDIHLYLSGSPYDIIHVNTSNIMLQFTIALFVKIDSIRIAHSHSSKPVMANPKIKDQLRVFFKRLFEPGCQYFIRKKNDYLLACSGPAGRALFGQQVLKSQKFSIIHNAIELRKFSYKKEVRLRIREQNNIDDNDRIYGYVGRLAESKNLLFLIDVFDRLHEKEPDTRLWMIGDGPMRSQIQEKIEAYGLSDVTVLWGEKEDVSAYLMAMDCFIFPTMYEGLGIAAIEAQAAGLPVVASDAVPDEARITDLMIKVPLKRDAAYWADTIEAFLNNRAERCEHDREIIDAGYDIAAEAKKLENFYERIQRKKH